MSVKIENISFSMTTTSSTPPQEGFDNMANKVMDKLAEICVGSEYNSSEHKLTYYGHEITCVGSGTSNTIKLLLKIKNISDSVITDINMTGDYSYTTVSHEDSTSFIWSFSTRMSLLKDNDSFFVDFNGHTYNLFDSRDIFGNCKVGGNNYFCYITSSSQAVLCDQSGNKLYKTASLGADKYTPYVVATSNQMDAGKIVYIDALLYDMTNIVAGVSTHNIISITATGLSKNTFINVNGKVYYILGGSNMYWIGLCAGDAE